MTETNLLNVAGIGLTPSEVHLFAQMLQSADHTYAFEKGDYRVNMPQTLQALDMLVLAGLIERFVDGDGEWMDLWIVTDAAVEWVQEPKVQADLSLIAREFGWCPSVVDISLTSCA